VDDLDARARAAAVAGGRLLVPPQAPPWGGRLAIVADPDGYCVELSEAPR
jgi:predicted enzyme related to lactoylglutathione lyase